MRVLVACERFGAVRDAMLERGHDAWSCDIAESDPPSDRHIVGDVREVLADDWQLLIAHPPCPYLANIAAPCHRGKCQHPGHDSPEYMGWRHGMGEAALAFFCLLRDASHIPLRAVENPQPLGFWARRMGRHDCVSNPFEHGDPVRKRTFWWLRGLPPLVSTAPVVPTGTLVPQKTGQAGPRDSMERSRTMPGLARAIADQWGGYSVDTPYSLLQV